MSNVSSGKKEICARLRLAREKAFGQRGRAAFARTLGLSPSTYIYYEKGRIPPADVLARAAEVASVRLEWLVTGQGGPDVAPAETRSRWAADLPPDLQAAMERFLESPGAETPSAPAVRAMADILGRVHREFPEKDLAVWRRRKLEETDGMIPVLGRTAAGLVGSYQELLGERPAVAVADIARRAMGLDVRSRPAESAAADDPLVEGAAAQLGEACSLVQLGEPLPSGVVEFVDAPALRRRYPEAFALRVDGESMAPRFQHGDVVVAAAGRAVRDGQAGLVQIRDRVGITLKLVRREETTVHLVPINERYDTERLAADEIDWMAPVLVSLRFTARR